MDFLGCPLFGRAFSRISPAMQVADLNKNPKLPYGDGEFDFVTNVVSVDYLVKPQEVRYRSPRGFTNKSTNGWSRLDYIIFICIH